MKLRRISALILSCLMVLSLLAGCGGNGSTDDSNSGDDGIVTLTLFDKNSGSKTQIR